MIMIMVDKFSAWAVTKVHNKINVTRSAKLNYIRLSVSYVTMNI